MLGLLLLLGLTSYIAYWFKRRREHFKRIGVWSPPLRHWLTGHSCQDTIATDKAVVAEEVAGFGRDYPDRETLGVYIGGSPHVITTNLDILQDVFNTKFPQMNGRWMMPLSPPDSTNALAGVFWVTGKTWRRQRGLIIQVFSLKNIRKLFPTMRSRAFALLDHLSATNEKPFIMYPMMNNYAMDVISKALDCTDEFDYQSNTDNVHANSLEDVFTHNHDIRRWSYMFPEFNLPLWLLLNKTRSVPMDPLIEDLFERVHKRMQSVTEENKPEDMIQFLIDSVDDSKVADEKNNVKVEKHLSEAEVVANAISLLFAGSDTQSGQLTVLLILMAHHPDTMTALTKEIDSVWSGEEDELTMDVLNEMPYTEALLKESMRLYPLAAVSVGRECLVPTVVGKGESAIRLEKGVHVTANVIGMHYRTDLWGDDAAEFVPDRWLSPESLPPTLGYMPFGAGRRICPGQKQAMIQMKCVLAVMAKFYTWEKCAQTPAKIHKIGGGAPYPKDSYLVVKKRIP